MEACGRDPDDLSSMLVVEADRRLSIKSDAAIRIAEVGWRAAPRVLMPRLGGMFVSPFCMVDLSGGRSPTRYSQVAAPHPALGAAFEQAARMLLPQGIRDGAYDTVRACVRACMCPCPHHGKGRGR